MRTKLKSLVEQLGFSSERVFDIQVAVGEAVANAIEHANESGEVRVRLEVSSDRLDVVVDGPGEFNLPRRDGEGGHRGLGLPLMAKLADHLALYSSGEGGTLVTLTFYRPGHSQGASAFPPTISDLLAETELLNQVLSNLPDGFYVLDEEWRFLYVNEQVCARLGMSREELVGLVIWDVVLDYDPAARRSLERAKDEGRTVRLSVHSPSRQVWREWSAFPVAEGMAVLSRDITDLKRIEAEREELFARLRQQKDELEAVLHSLNEGVVISDTHGNVVHMNAEALRLHGFETVEQVKRALWEWPEFELFDPTGRPLATEEWPLSRVVSGESFSDYQVGVRNAGVGEPRIWSYGGAPVLGEDGRPVLAVLSVQDVTDRRRAEREQDRLLAERTAVMEGMTEGLTLADPSGAIVYHNPASLALHGYESLEEALLPREDVVGGWQVTDLEGEPLPVARWPMPRVLDGETLENYRVRVRRADGHVEFVGSYNGSLVKGPEGETLFAMLTIRDISEEYRTARALESSEERYRTLFDNMTEGFAVGEVDVDEEGNPRDFRFIDVNEAFERQSGLDRSILNRSVAEALPELEREWIETYGHVALTGETVRFTRFNRDTGRHYEVLSYSPGYRRFAIIFTDVTERIEAEEGLQRELRVSSLLREVAAAAASSMEIRSVCQAVLAVIRETLDARAGIVQYLDDEAGLLRSLASFGLPEAQAAALDEAPLDRTSGIGAALLDDGPQLTVDAASDPPLSAALVDAAGGHGDRWIVVPVRSRGNILGGLVLSFTGRRPFTQEELDLYDAIADQLGVAMENARLYERQRSIAQELQTSLLTLPTEVAGVEFAHLYRSSTEAARVGGDFYDVFEAGEGKVGVLIGDVCGHGIEAARQAALVRDTIRAFSYSVQNLCDVLRLADRFLDERGGVGGFVSVFLGVLDVSTQELAYCNAGHPPPFVRVGREVRTLEGTSVPLASGLTFDGDVLVSQLERGASLFLYTDGVTESRAGGELFGEERLGEVIRDFDGDTTSLPRYVYREVMRFSGGARQDDFAAVALCLQ